VSGIPMIHNVPSKKRGSMGLIRGNPSGRRVASMHSLPAAAWRRTKISAIRGACAANSSQVAMTRDRSDGRCRVTSVGRVLLTAAGSVLLLVDFQLRLVPAIHDSDTVVARAVRLAEAAHVLGVPICATEQYPTGLGPIVAELAGYPQNVVAKTSFSGVADPTLLPPAVREVVVAGVEAHVCVLQTVADLLAGEHRVVVVADAVGSRDPANRDVALQRMRAHGAEIVTSEMVLFEWLRDSMHPRFREVQKLLR
jgi:nicotinamidase-related amidase